MTKQLTDSQVKNWRRILSVSLGPYAFFIPREQIQEFRDRLSMEIAEDIQPAQVNCYCDRTYYGQTVHADGHVTCNHCHQERIAEEQVVSFTLVNNADQASAISNQGETNGKEE